MSVFSRKMNTKILKLKTEKFFDIVDLTDDVAKFLNEIDAKNGLVNVFTRHTTVSIKINEKEDGFLEDLNQILFNNVAKKSRQYHHNDTHIRDPRTICPVAKGSDCLNGHSHVAQMFMGSASETIPVLDGKMLLGTWQRIMMFEFDHDKEREVVLSFVSS